jgi:outer membrane immunogenic protein
MMKIAPAIAVISALLGTEALAADLPMKMPSPVVAPSPNWTGFYIGGDVGGLWTSSNATWLPSPIIPSNPIANVSTNASSAVGGVHAGYNWQFSPTWVAGLEGDWSWTHASGSFNQLWPVTIGLPTPGISTTMSSTLDWLASIRGRLGYLISPTLLAYVTGGAAWGKFDYSANASDLLIGPPAYIASAAFSNTAAGYVVGGGLEWAMTTNWFLRTEYLYYHLDSSQTVVVVPPGSVSSTFIWSNTSVYVGRVGLSYKF